MSPSLSRRSLKSAALTLSLIAAALSASAAHAASPRLWAREVAGDYHMEDGSTVRIGIVDRRVLVESSTVEYWTALSSNLLVSPDGLRRIKLLRDFDGTVDRIELQIDSAPLAETAGATRQAAAAAPPTEP